jgi:hypothetical protein
MSVAVFDRTVASRDASLRLANQVRCARARMKLQLRAGALEAAVLVHTPPDYLASMKTWKFLHALPGWGPSRVRKVMRQVGIAEGKTIGGLSSRQRDELVLLLGGVVHA